ncbi:Uncharacterised protein [BD1-7 clade bacterium]|uniref:Uncharacterized protein n=1 Tax=BD1-7 clade bacterium TaxID=2029982 RepID=A0A5S9PWJ0_9GAMM|nr:Uncharacterised protein [BD1-7 clade bacterium]CAA0113318.1 Uncharacterised protein [BD1-7 clade bacterium]
MFERKNIQPLVKCLKGAASKPYEVVAETQQPCIDEIKTKVIGAYNLLKDEKTTEATLLLHDLVREFESDHL